MTGPLWLCGRRGELMTEILKWASTVVVPLIQVLIWPTILIVLFIFYKNTFKNFFKKVDEVEVDFAGFKAKFSGDKPEELSKKVIAAVSQFNSAMNTVDFESQTEAQGDQAAIFADPDVWHLYTKASNRGLSRSTKVLNVPTGVVIQVSTIHRTASGHISSSDALTFVPGVVFKFDPEHKNSQFEKLEEV